MITAKLTALVTVLSVVYTIYLALRVGAQRTKTGVAAPATTGHPDFERAFRIHMNMVEQMVLFLPVLWLSVAVIGDMWTAAIGLVWLIGRVVYAVGYTRDPSKRGTGMMIAMLATFALILVTLFGIVHAFIY